jgi:hypothetical protein
MSKTSTKQSLSLTLDRIQATLSELRQTEALEAQVHEMVVMKRHRLDALMTEFIELSAEGAPAISQVLASLEAPAPIAAPAPVVAPVAAPVPEPVVAKAAVAPAIERPRPAVEDMQLTAHGTYGAPRDLLKDRPTPTAQHVLDSLNRLMTGIKDMPSKQASAIA